MGSPSTSAVAAPGGNANTDTATAGAAGDKKDDSKYTLYVGIAAGTVAAAAVVIGAVVIGLKKRHASFLAKKTRRPRAPPSSVLSPARGDVLDAGVVYERDPAAASAAASAEQVSVHIVEDAEAQPTLTNVLPPKASTVRSSRSPR